MRKFTLLDKLDSPTIKKERKGNTEAKSESQKVGNN